MAIFQGVCPALVTPFNEKGIDFDKLEELINWQIDAGASAILLCGTTGEAPTIAYDEKLELFIKGSQIINGRVPFIAGTGTNSTQHIIQLCEYAERAHADALLINNPYYNKSSDDGIYYNYKAISDSVSTPIIVYNVPSRTGKNISPQLALRLCAIEHVVGFKEASGNISQIAKLIAEVSKLDKEIAVYAGNDDQTLPIMALGGMGVISTVANILPEQMCALCNALLEGDYEKARSLQFGLLRMNDALFCECNPIPLKTAMNLIGMQVGPLRLPLYELMGEKLAFLKEVLVEYGFSVAEEA